MTTPHNDADEADRLARVKLSSTIEPGDLRVTGLVSELGAGKVLDYLESAGEVENHWGFAIGQELTHVDPSQVLEQAASRGIRFIVPGGPTIAVMPCGVDRPYPAAHAQLLEAIAERGLVVAEAPPGAAPTCTRFLARNRAVAGLSEGTVVVEGAIRRGALNTAQWADNLHRPLMGIPGPVSSAASVGVNQLIRRGQASMVTNARRSSPTSPPTPTRPRPRKINSTSPSSPGPWAPCRATSQARSRRPLRLDDEAISRPCE